MKKGRVVILSGPSGSGKTTLYQRLLSHKKFKKILSRSISATTRQRRVGEKAGKDYLFFTKKQFLAHKRQGFFLEWQKVFSSYYGTPLKRVTAILGKGKNVLLAIDVNGARAVCRKVPDAVTIFIKTPSLKILKARLQVRGTEESRSLKMRLQTARKELKEAHFYKYVLVNDNLETCYEKLLNILERELGLERQE
jgi:guanylate kinase